MLKLSASRRDVAASTCTARAAIVLALAAAPAVGQSTFVNWETAPVHPVDMTPDGTKLLVTSVADNRLEVFALGGPLPVRVASIPVGLDPVSVRARNNTEAWVVNFISDTVSVVSLTTLNVVATLRPGDEPADVVFAGSPQRAWVSVSGLNQLKRYDPASLATAPTTINLAEQEPRALATDGQRVLAASFQSADRSTILPASVVSDPAGPYGGVNPPPNSGTTFNPPMTPGLPAAPPVSLVVNREGAHWKDDNQHLWDAFVSWNFNEHDVAIVDTATLGITYVNNVLNIGTALAFQPGTGKVAELGYYLPNEARFETGARAHLVHDRIVTIDPLSPTTPGIQDLNQHLFISPPNPQYKTTVTTAERNLSIGDPRGIAWNAAGTAAYVSGMGSSNVIKTNLTGTRLATINVGQGPSGLVFDAPRSRLYCLNRFDATVSSINTTTDTEVGRVSFYDPTPAAIRTGRPLFYDSHATSLRGQASCNSCHIDGAEDHQAWDLGNPAGLMKLFDQTCDAGLPVAGICSDWHPMKGPLLTQPLRDLNGAQPFHWRGDREDLAAFSVGFTGLLGLAAAPTSMQMAVMDAFLNTIQSAPQPNRTLDDQTPASVPGYAGDPIAGDALFHGPAIDGAMRCIDCHSLPTGAGATIVAASIIGESQGLKPPQLRNLYTRTGFSKASTTNNRGFGYGHDGAADSVFAFLQNHVVQFPAGSSGVQMRRDLEAYLMAFPTATHAAVGVQVTVDGTNNNSPSVVSLISTMQSLADAGKVGLIAKGRVGGAPRGYAYSPAMGLFQSDRLAETASVTTLRLTGATGGEITFTITPSGSQARIGIDRDQDGYLDTDETDHGSDPADPSSTPPTSCRPAIATQPLPATVPPGQPVSLSVVASGAVLYQWSRDGVSLADDGRISGAATDTLTIDPAATTDTGAYTVTISNGCGPTLSTPAALTVICKADLTGDGLVDFADYLDFLNRFDAADLSVDFTGDGLVDFSDYLEFLNLFSAGC